MCYCAELCRQEAVAETEERGTYLNSPRLGENFHEGGAQPEPWMMSSVVSRCGEIRKFRGGR